MLNASYSRRQCWLGRHSRRHLARCSRPRHRLMMSARVALRHRHSLPSSSSLDVESPTSPVVTLRCLPLYRELNGLQDVLRTPAGTAAAAKQRGSTFCYERLVSRTADASCDVDHGHHDDVADEDDETRLTMTVHAVTPLLTANVAVLADSAVSVEEKCLALDELLYLVEGAWTMPVIGREVAYRVCDVLREQGGVDLLLSIMSGRTTESTDRQAGDIIVLMSAIVLSQVMGLLMVIPVLIPRISVRISPRPIPISVPFQNIEDVPYIFHYRAKCLPNL